MLLSAAAVAVNPFVRVLCAEGNRLRAPSSGSVAATRDTTTCLFAGKLEPTSSERDGIIPKSRRWAAQLCNHVHTFLLQVDLIVLAH